LIRYFFDDFLEVFFPEIYKQIDLASISFVSGEVFTDVVKGSSRRLDMVVETKLRDTEAIILLHVESQSSVQYDFNERMFQYYCYLYNHYQKPIIPIAVFSYDENWQKNQYKIEVLDKVYLTFRYNTLHLRKENWRNYIKKDSPEVPALLSKMGFKEVDRVQLKIEMLRMLMRLELNEAEQDVIYDFFDTYLNLTEEEEEKYMKASKEFEDDDGIDLFDLPKYREQQAIERGMQRGLEEGMEKGLEKGIEKG